MVSTEDTYTENSHLEKWLPVLPKYYFDFGFLTFVIPFRLKLESGGTGTQDKHYYTARRWWPQSVLCFLCNILMLLYFLHEFRSTNINDPRNPAQYFMLFYKLIRTSTLIYQLKQFWLDGDRFAEIVTFLLNSRRESLPQPNAKEVLKVWLMVVLIALVDLIKTSFWTVEPGWNPLVATGKSMLFLKESQILANNSSLETLFGVVGLLGRLYLAVALNLENVFLLLSSFILWMPVREFMKGNSVPRRARDHRKKVQTEVETKLDGERQDSSWDSMLEEYDALKQLVSLLNDVVAIRIATLVCRAMIYIACGMVGPMEFTGVLDKTFDMVMLVTTLICAADSAHRVLTYYYSIAL